MGYQSQALKGVSWVGLLRAFIRGLNFIRTAILARILSPNQFGVFGVAALVLGLVEMLTETGINIVLVQEKNEADIDSKLNTAWVTSIFRGLLIFLVICLSAYPLSLFFHNSQALPLLLLISFTPLIRGFINPAVVKFQKRLRFDQEFFYRLSFTLVETIVSLTLALTTHSPVSLVWGLTASALTEVLFSWVFLKPRPRWAFALAQFKLIFHRGKWVTFAGVVNYLYLNGPDLAIGKLLDTASLGIYQMAFRFGYTPIAEVGDISNRVTFPIFVSIAADKVRARRAYYKNTVIMFSLLFPLTLVLVFWPKFIVNFLLGNQWLAAAPLLPLLGITVLLASLTAPASSLLLAIRRQRQVFLFNLIRTLGLWLVVLPLIQHYGVLGGALALLFATLLALPYTIYCIHQALY